MDPRNWNLDALTRQFGAAVRCSDLSSLEAIPLTSVAEKIRHTGLHVCSRLDQVSSLLGSEEASSSRIVLLLLEQCLSSVSSPHRIAA